MFIRMNDFIKELTPVSDSTRRDLSFDTLHAYAMSNKEGENRVVTHEWVSFFKIDICRER